MKSFWGHTIEGFSRMFNIFGTPISLDIPDDNEAIHSDWVVVGQSLEAAIDEVVGSQSEQCKDSLH